jgi:hypothetical protein
VLSQIKRNKGEARATIYATIHPAHRRFIILEISLWRVRQYNERALFVYLFGLKPALFFHKLMLSSSHNQDRTRSFPDNLFRCTAKEDMLHS